MAKLHVWHHRPIVFIVNACLSNCSVTFNTWITWTVNFPPVWAGGGAGVIAAASCDCPNKDTVSIKCCGATAWSCRVKQSNVYLMHYNEIRYNNVTHLGCLACVETAVLPNKHHRGLTLTSADQTWHDMFVKHKHLILVSIAIITDDYSPG